jgi:type IV secretory pathway VirB10-like protein
MEQRRKIIIPVGGDPQGTIPAPHFDAEATLSAQPVVPLKGSATPPSYNNYGRQGSGGSAQRAARASSPWKRSTLLLVILAAIGVGVASGLAIGFYESRGKVEAPVVGQPAASESQQPTTPQQPEPTQSTRAKQPETEARTPAETSDQQAQKNSDDENQKESRENVNQPVARDNRKQTEERVPPAVGRDKPTNDTVADERDDRRGRRGRSRDDRRQREDDSTDPLNMPRNIKRARQEINRIRDIFEGRQP